MRASPYSSRGWALAAVRGFRQGFQPLLEIVWVTEDIFERAVEALLAARTRGISLTDWSMPSQ